jgi:NADH-quinone oxidoreductase subunit G
MPSDVGARLSNATTLRPELVRAAGGTQRIADVPIYFSDAIVRRAESLQKTRDARPPKASANAATLAKFGLSPGAKARVVQATVLGEASALLECVLDEGLPDGVVRVPAAHASTATLGPMFGPIALERA